MGRLEGLPADRLSTEQRGLFDAILSGRRGQSVAATGREGAAGGLLDATGALVGPFNAWLLSPAIGDRIQRLGESIRFGSSLPQNVLEVAILVEAREWRAEFEWWAHVRLARRAGVGAEVIAAIQEEREPVFADPGEEIAWRFSRELLDAPPRERRHLSRGARALRREGRDGAGHAARLLHAGVDDAQRVRGPAAGGPGAGVRATANSAVLGAKKIDKKAWYSPRLSTRSCS